MENKEAKKTLGQILAEESLECAMGMIATRYVLIRGNDINDILISTGITDLLNIWTMAENGEIPEAENIEISYCGCDITLTGRNLISFSKRYIEKYGDNPLWNVEKIEAAINLENIYKIMCFDFS